MMQSRNIDVSRIQSRDLLDSKCVFTVSIANMYFLSILFLCFGLQEYMRRQSSNGVNTYPSSSGVNTYPSSERKCMSRGPEIL